MAHIPRLYIETEFRAGREVSLNTDQMHHLRHVLRLKQGASVKAFNGQDGEWLCALVGQSKHIALKIEKKLRDMPAHQTPALTLVFAPIRKARQDFMMEKATELGIAHLQPVKTAYSQIHSLKSERIRAQLIEAAQQSERLDIPALYELCSLDSLLETWPECRPLIFCDEAGGGAPLLAVLNALQKAADKPLDGAGILIGPEGGFSPEERARVKAFSFIQPVSLGPNILRAETAALSAIVICQSALGGWG